MKTPKTLKVNITLLEEFLGMASANPEIHAEYIAAKAASAKEAEEEVEAIDAATAMEKAMTVFPRDSHHRPAMWNYQIKGMFKDSCGMLRRVPGSESADLKAHNKVIDGVIFVQPRLIPLVLPKGGVIGKCQRPLRAQTAQGERIALATSETVPAGTTLSFDVVLLNPALEKYVIEWLDYGKLRGLGTWRNSGKGIFEYEVTGNGVE